MMELHLHSAKLFLRMQTRLNRLHQQLLVLEGPFWLRTLCLMPLGQRRCKGTRAAPDLFAQLSFFMTHPLIPCAVVKLMQFYLSQDEYLAHHLIRGHTQLLKILLLGAALLATVQVVLSGLMGQSDATLIFFTSSYRGPPVHCLHLSFSAALQITCAYINRLRVQLWALA
jgi:hypothetical protein